MDPAVVVISAMRASSVVKLGSSAVSGAVSDSYQRLKTKLLGRTADPSAARDVVERYEEDPESCQAVLHRFILDQDISRDPEVVKAAQNLLGLLDKEGTDEGKYQVTMNSSQGVQIGDYNTQRNSFGNSA